MASLLKSTSDTCLNAMPHYCPPWLDCHLSIDAQMEMVSFHLSFSDHGIDPFSLHRHAAGFATILDVLHIDICNKTVKLLNITSNSCPH